jgi:hypothetical protein
MEQTDKINPAPSRRYMLPFMFFPGFLFDAEMRSRGLVNALIYIPGDLSDTKQIGE